MKEIAVVEAAKGKLLSETGFRNYDFCLNTYVGCAFGCSYCYVRAYVRDSEHEWGEFVRLRLHVKTKLPKELPAVEGKRLVLGTMIEIQDNANGPRNYKGLGNSIEAGRDIYEKPSD
jgi:DNA repair photolyase